MAAIDTCTSAASTGAGTDAVAANPLVERHRQAVLRIVVRNFTLGQLVEAAAQVKNRKLRLVILLYEL